jgi:hypothetical protein
MMWCGQSQFGRILTSHPALEGTFCGPNKWCNLGRCVPWTGSALPSPPTFSPQTAAPIATTAASLPTVGRYQAARNQPQRAPIRPPPTNLPKAGQPQPAWLSRTKARLRAKQLGRGRAVVPIRDMFYAPKKPAFENGDSFRLRRRRMH